MVSFTGDASPHALQIAQRLKLRHLRFVRVLAETGSLARTAELLAVSYPAVVKTRKEIEAVVGARLVDGRGDTATLTAVGRRLAESGAQVLELLECLGEELVFLREGLRGHVVVGVRLSDGLRWVAPAIVDFRARHPAVTVALVDGLHQSVAEDAVDIALGRMGPPRWIGVLAFEPLLPVRAVVVSSDPAVPAARADGTIDWAVLLSRDWCLPPQGTPLRDRFDDFLRAQQLLPPSSVTEINELATHVALMKAGPFLGLCSEGSGRMLEEEGTARVVSPPLPALDDHLALIWRAQRRLRPVVQTLKDFLLQRALADRSALSGAPLPLSPG